MEHLVQRSILRLRSSIARVSRNYPRFSRDPTVPEISKISTPFLIQRRWKRIVRTSPDQGKKKKKENPPLSYNEIRSLPKSRLIGHDGKNIGEFQGEEILRRAASKGFDVYQVSEIPPVVRFAEHVLKPEVKKVKSKLKEIRIRDVISEHDLKIKINRIKEFLVDQYTVQVVLNFKRRSEIDVEVASVLMDNIVARLSDFAQIDFSEKMTKDLKSVCVLKPLTREQYIEKGVEVDKQMPGEREKEKSKEKQISPEKEAERLKKLERKRLTKERLNGVARPAVEEFQATSIPEPIVPNEKIVLDIRRTKELLDSGLSYGEALKIIQKERELENQPLRSRKSQDEDDYDLYEEDYDEQDMDYGDNEDYYHNGKNMMKEDVDIIYDFDDIDSEVLEDMRVSTSKAKKDMRVTTPRTRKDTRRK